MKIFHCQLQAYAKRQVISSLEANDLVFLLGKPLTGKSTLLSLLFARIDFTRKIWPIIIRSSHSHLSGSLRQSLVSALGLPSWVVDNSNSALLSVLREVNSRDLTVVLVIDDIDSFVKGGFSRYPELCEFIQFLRKEIKGLKVVVTMTNYNRIDTLAEDFKSGRHSLITLNSWQASEDLASFVIYVAKAYSIKKHQVVGEDFLSALHLSTRGATGAIIQTVKILAMSGVLANGKVATSENISQLWMFKS
ncbi:AAA family ATPase [Pseudomonas putida]|uniref:AAA family ATPase n=1 Tax=Pseudomonas putida TaxID=303 RepID=UPI002B25163D|nr:AAA family ATPase [Pseudomonas putida]